MKIPCVCVCVCVCVCACVRACTCVCVCVCVCSETQCLTKFTFFQSSNGCSSIYWKYVYFKCPFHGYCGFLLHGWLRIFNRVYLKGYFYAVLPFGLAHPTIWQLRCISERRQYVLSDSVVACGLAVSKTDGIMMFWATNNIRKWDMQVLDFSDCFFAAKVDDNCAIILHVITRSKSI